MSLKMFLITCLTILSSVVSADVQPGVIQSNDTAGLQKACSDTITNCQTGLAGVKGSGSLIAILLSLQLAVVIGPLLASLVALLTPLLSSVLSLVVQLLTVVLAAVVALVNLVIKLLSGLISPSDYNKQVDSWKTDTNSKVQSYSNTGVGGLVSVVLNLLLNLLNICLSLTVNLAL